MARRAEKPNEVQRLATRKIGSVSVIFVTGWGESLVLGNGQTHEDAKKAALDKLKRWIAEIKEM